MITAFKLTRFAVPRQRVIGDTQVRSDTHHIGAMELIDNQGQEGLGFFISLFTPLPSQQELERIFAAELGV